jgi:ubiquinone/menaquinone biosynthesis C-methylase UbiE
MKDNFSSQSNEYARYRPQYPQALFDYIFEKVAHKNLAWDCGTGNGQTAFILSRYFNNVYASDISNKQLANAQAAPNIRYEAAAAECSSLEDNSADLITVSQALHWFNFEKFYAEVKRVGKKNSVIAAWTYSLLKVSPEIDPLIKFFHDHTLDSYWDNERHYVNQGYSNLPFPFQQISDPGFSIDVHWDKNQLFGYIATWSAWQKFLQKNTSEPLQELMNQVQKLWPGSEPRKMQFPLFLKMGFIHQ